jgi:excisionase family DNA binding protein
VNLWPPPRHPIRMDLRAHDIAPPVARVLVRLTSSRVKDPREVDWVAWMDLDRMCRLILRGHRAEPSWWIPEQAAEVLGCTPQHVRRLLADGTLTGWREGCSWRVDPSSVRVLKFAGGTSAPQI